MYIEYPAISKRLIKPQIKDPLPKKPCEIKVLQPERHSSQKKLNLSLVFVALILVMSLLPSTTEASVFSGFIKSAEAGTVDGTPVGKVSNSQNMPLAMASIGPSVIDKDTSTASSDVVISDAALAPSIGPVGNVSDADQSDEAGVYITTYTVHAGDTFKSISNMFDVTPATIMWANDLTASSKLKDGMVLTIPSISGRIIIVAKGNTLQSLAKKYGVDAGEIAYANEMTLEDSLTVGDTLIIPDDSLASPKDKTTTKSTKTKKSTARSTNRPSAGNYFAYPLPVGSSHWIRGLHGNCGCGIDVGAPKGTPIYAVADGTVIVAKPGGYNAGWGTYVVINHTLPNGLRAQTLSAHMSSLATSVGQTVHQGDVIGYVGSTGHSTGPHLHIEVSGVANPFANPSYGR